MSGCAGSQSVGLSDSATMPDESRHCWLLPPPSQERCRLLGNTGGEDLPPPRCGGSPSSPLLSSWAPPSRVGSLAELG